MKNFGVGLEINNLSLTLSNNSILENINLTVEPGEIHCLIGPNGGGKTSLIRCILGQLPFEGEILMKYEKYKKIGYVTQTLNFENNFPITVEDFLAIIHQKKPCIFGLSNDIKEPIYEILKKVGMYEKRKRLFGDLSGGERQRILLAQAIYPKPNLLILDEPFSGIDKIGEEYFIKIIKELKDEGVTILWINHNIKQVIEIADKVTCIKKEVKFSGLPDKELDDQRIFEIFA